MATNINVHQDEAHAERTRGGQCYVPHVDILETDGELQLVADMPGAQSDSIDINFEDRLLTIQARVEPRGQAAANYLLYEYGVGDYYRTFRVSEQIDSTRIHADYAHGVLTVHLPKIEKARPRKIAVNAN